MKILSSVENESILRASLALNKGQLVAFPTETVYGLGADASNEKAVKRIFTVKNRPFTSPLIVHIADATSVHKLAEDVPDYVQKLTNDFWPGPLTLILKKKSSVSNFVTGNQKFVGIRVPKNIFALEMLKEFEKFGKYGVAAPSANRFQSVSPTTGQDVFEELGDKLDSNDLIIEDGQTLIGIESTIIYCGKKYVQVLRPGAITQSMLEKSIPGLVKIKKEIKIMSPGNHKKHYSPKAKIVFDRAAEPGWGYIALNNIPTPPKVLRLASPRNSAEFAKILYLSFRNADRLGIKTVLVQIPSTGKYREALADRVLKAAGINKK